MDRLYFLKVGDYYYCGARFWKWTKNWRKAAVLPHYEWSYLIKRDSDVTFYQILSLEEAVNGVCETYRNLSTQEVIRAGDEIQYIDGTWHTALLFIGRDAGRGNYRRKITLDN